MFVLPLIILVAFEFGGNSGNGGGDRGQFAALADIATSGGLNFALFTLLVSASFLLVVVVALFHGDTIASEASWGSLRYLLAIPVPRARLLGSKLLVALTYSGISLILLTGDGAGRRDGALRLASAALERRRRHRGRTGAVAAARHRRVPRGHACSSSPGSRSCCRCRPTRRSARSVARSCCRSCRASWTRSPRWARFATTCRRTTREAWLGLLSTPVQYNEMIKGAIAALVYATIFFGFAWWRFLRKDVVS